MPDLKQEILNLGFVEAYTLWDAECEYTEGEAFAKNGLTICLRKDKFTMVDRWTGRYLIKNWIHKGLINEIKKHLNS